MKCGLAIVVLVLSFLFALFVWKSTIGERGGFRLSSSNCPVDLIKIHRLLFPLSSKCSEVLSEYKRFSYEGDCCLGGYLLPLRLRPYGRRLLFFCMRHRTTNEAVTFAGSGFYFGDEGPLSKCSLIASWEPQKTRPDRCNSSKSLFGS